MSITTASTSQTAAASEYVQKPEDKSEGGNFLALLNIGSVSADNNASPVAAHPEYQTARPTPRQESTQQTTEPSQKALPRLQKQDEPTPQVISASTKREEKPEPTATEAPNPIAKKPDLDTKKDGEKSPTPQKADKADNTAKSDHEETIAERQKKIREQLDDQLSSIAQILQALIDTLSNAKPTANTNTAPTATEPTASDSTAPTIAAVETIENITPAAVTDLASLLASLTPIATPQTTVAETITAQTTQANTTADPTAKIEIPASLLTQDTKDDLALLKDIQSLLLQLKDNLKAVDNTTKTAPTSTTQALNIPAQLSAAQQTQPTPEVAKTIENIIVNVQQDVAALSQRFTLPENETATITISSTTAETENTASEAATLPITSEIPKPKNILAFLKDSITQVREQLQSLKNDNETLYTQSKLTLQQQFESLQASVRKTQPQAATTIASDTTAITDAALPAAAPTATAPITSPTIQASQQSIAPVAIFISQTATTNDAGQQSSQQGQTPSQQQASAVTPSSSGQTGNTDISRTEAPNFARAIARNQQLPLSEQVAYQVKTAINEGTSKIRIQLDPADLGKMDIKLTIDASGKTGVSIMVDNKSTLDLLQRDAAALTRALNEAGLSADSASLNFNLRGGQQENQQSNQQASHTYQKALPPEEEIPLQNIINRNYVVNLSDGLDIKI